MPVFPDAPGTFETGSATPSTGWVRLEICRAIVSAPPPVPHVQMISIGRLGNFSCAATWLTATASRTHASVRTLIVDLPTAVPGSGRLPQQAAQHLARRGLRKRVAELDDPRDLVRGEPRPAELLDLARPHLEAGGVDQVFQSIDDREVSLVVHARDVAGLEPAITQRLGRRRGPVPVPEHDLGPADEQLAGLA